MSARPTNNNMPEENIVEALVGVRVDLISQINGVCLAQVVVSGVGYSP